MVALPDPKYWFLGGEWWRQPPLKNLFWGADRSHFDLSLEKKLEYCYKFFCSSDKDVVKGSTIVGGVKYDGAALSDLTDDLIVEILLRLSPENRGWWCKRASLVCKSWHRILSDPSFRRRYVDLHWEEILRSWRFSDRVREEVEHLRRLRNLMSPRYAY